jgi:hypothetical protein
MAAIAEGENAIMNVTTPAMPLAQVEAGGKPTRKGNLRCQQCGRDFRQPKHGRKRRFCCRLDAVAGPANGPALFCSRP